ncbi:MAG: phosphatase PAP2 family protein [Bacteroidota bacterium]|nr:phosphatase PAP2 family protein [Bacteroidota bacterium]
MRIILAIFLFLLTLFVFVYIADEIVLEHETHFDQNILSAIAPLHSSGMTSVMKVFTFFGSSTFLFPAYSLLIIYFLIKKNKQIAIDIAAIGLTSTGILFLLKDIFQRHRPLDPLIRNVTGFSFPSGHSFSSFTFYGLAAYLLWQTNMSKTWKIIVTIFLFLFPALIAFSRVYLQVHFPSDVVAGFCLSVVWLVLSFWILQRGKVSKKPDQYA